MREYLTNPLDFSQAEKTNSAGRPKHLPGWLGIDEAGRGCLAGPVVAAAVFLPEKFELDGLDDSKKLNPTQRQNLEQKIKTQSLAWSLGFVWPADIDKYNILQATFMAMSRAVALLPWPVLDVQLKGLLIDGNFNIPTKHLREAFASWNKSKAGYTSFQQQAVIKGDARILSIAAASVLAKTARDRFMQAADKRYPGYGFAGHKGYGTKQHLEAINSLGPCALHRLTFRGCM